jgi:hypothetical protein
VHFDLAAPDSLINSVSIRFRFLQSGLCTSSDLETPGGHNVRIHHLTASANILNSLPPKATKANMAPNASAADQERVFCNSPLDLMFGTSSSLFPRLEDCAHFHYECTESLGPLSISLVDDAGENNGEADRRRERIARPSTTVPGGKEEKCFR